MKVKLINTRKFLITLRFSSTKLIVIGDLRSEKELKVIEIDKIEALEFIEENCLSGDSISIHHTIIMLNIFVHCIHYHTLSSWHIANVL